MWNDFKAFLIKQNALALAIGVVIGAALNNVVDAIVKGLIGPIVALVTPDPARWESATLGGPIAIRYGLIINAIVNFLIVGFVAWRLSKLFIREPADTKPATKKCPFCRMEDLDIQAVRCPHCTSALDGAAVTG